MCNLWGVHGQNQNSSLWLYKVPCMCLMCYVPVHVLPTGKDHACVHVWSAMKMICHEPCMFSENHDIPFQAPRLCQNMHFHGTWGHVAWCH